MGADILVGTPGRLIDFMSNGRIDLSAIETICLDEADEMLKIGFKEDIEMIFKYIYKSCNRKIQCLLFSATIPDWIWDISQKYQEKPQFVDMLKDGFTMTSKTV
jgi:superfamily II DNA/RNA helicase